MRAPSSLFQAAVFVSFLFLGAGLGEAREIPEQEAIANWPAPLLWTPPASRSAGTERAEAVDTATSPLSFVAVTPCRVADTRGNGFTGQYGPPSLVANATRNFTIGGQCGIPGTAAAVSFNFVALNAAAAGDLRVFPTGGFVPLVSTLNYNSSTPNIANAAVVLLGSGAAITFQADATAIDLIIDVNGYYAGALVTSLNSLTGAVTLAAGTNLSLTPSGQTLTIGGPASLPPSGPAGGDLAGNYPNPSLKLPASFAVASFPAPVVIFMNSDDGTYFEGAKRGYGVIGNGANTGVWGQSNGGGTGVYGSAGGSGTPLGVWGTASQSPVVSPAYIGKAGVWGDSYDGVGAYGTSFSNVGVAGVCVPGHTAGCKAGVFIGNVEIQGNLTKTTGSFRIDHPLDPENKFLYHSFVESPDMKNIYDGIATLDDGGEAEVALPDWFEALNQDFRYQLTAIGKPAPGLYISEKLAGNRFRIAGGQPGAEVSWQVTGIRHDSYANAHRIQVEVEKTPAEREARSHPERSALSRDGSVAPAGAPAKSLN